MFELSEKETNLISGGMFLEDTLGVGKDFLDTFCNHPVTHACLIYSVYSLLVADLPSSELGAEMTHNLTFSGNFSYWNLAGYSALS